MPANFDRIARPYRWLEYLSFGPMLERCRFYRIPQLAEARHALVLGDGDGRFLARLLARNPSLHTDVIDQSPAMLRLLESRVAAVHAPAVHANDRIHIHHADALTLNLSELRECSVSRKDSSQPYDCVITHFFLDCFTTAEVLALAEKIRPNLAPNALWIISEFAVPSGPAALPAKSIVAALYSAFRIITGLRTRSLPDYSAALIQAGFTLEDRKPFLSGLLTSELWKIKKLES